MQDEVQTYGPRDLKRIFGISSDSTLVDWVKRGVIPEPRWFNKRVRRWSKATIDRIAEGTKADAI